MKILLTSLLAVALLQQQPDAETRVVNYLKANVKPGQPVIMADLVKAFKTPDEQQALGRLYNTFFKIPMAVVEFQSRTKRTPTLKELSEQFAFKVPGEMDVVLRILDADPRIPKFMTRDARTGEITRVDIAMIKADPNFGKVVERRIAGWEGQTAPPFAITQFSGQPLNSTTLKGQPHLVYFWFSNCPPCVATTPVLVKLHAKYSAQGFKIVAANADKVLELPYSDAIRTDYIKKQGVQFTTGHLTTTMQQAYGDVALFPTLFFVNKQGKIVKHLVSLQTEATLDAAIKETLK
jgi:thiol-disulfide isomerase/thioredoxin